jgi:hypothetical protein
MPRHAQGEAGAGVVQVAFCRGYGWAEQAIERHRPDFELRGPSINRKSAPGPRPVHTRGREAILPENCCRFASGAPLLNVIDKANWFSGPPRRLGCS